MAASAHTLCLRGKVGCPHHHFTPPQFQGQQQHRWLLIQQKHPANKVSSFAPPLPSLPHQGVSAGCRAEQVLCPRPEKDPRPREQGESHPAPKADSRGWVGEAWAQHACTLKFQSCLPAFWCHDLGRPVGRVRRSWASLQGPGPAHCCPCRPRPPDLYLCSF